MSISKKSAGLGATLALAAAGMLGTVTSVSADEMAAPANVKCHGVNKCGGFNDCKTANNACAAKAACKGQGFVSMPKATCDKIGGTVK